MTYRALGDAAKDKVCFQTAIAEGKRTRSGYPLPYLNLGSLLLDAGDAEGALPLLETAVSMAPTNAAARQRLGEAYWKLHRDAEAERELLEALAKAPDAAALHFLLGRIEHREGKEEAADREFARARALSEGAARTEVPNRIAPAAGADRQDSP